MKTVATLLFVLSFASSLAKADAYLDDRSTPESLIRSAFRATVVPIGMETGNSISNPASETSMNFP